MTEVTVQSLTNPAPRRSYYDNLARIVENLCGAPSYATSESVLSLSLPLHSTSDLMLTLSARIDEAGCDGKSPCLIMGGFVGSIVRWEQFDRAWRKRLKQAGMTYFHASEFWGSKNETRDVPFAEKQARVRRFWDAHDGRLLFGFCNRLDNSDYAHYREVLPQKEHRDSQYGLTFRFTIASVVENAIKYTKRDDLHIHFLLESGHSNSGDAVRIFQEIKNLHSEYASVLGTLSFGDKKKHPGLQAADGIIATAQRLEARNDQNYKSIDPAAKLDDLRTEAMKTPIFRGHIDRDHIADLSQARTRLKELRRQAWLEKNRASKTGTSEG